MKNKSNYIFFLQLGAKPTESYFQMARQFSDEGITLLPVTISSLITMISGGQMAHVVCLVSTMKEREIYLKRVQKTLSYLVKRKIVYLYQASSFHTLMQTEAFHQAKKNYFFIELPVKLARFCATISKYYFLRQNEELKWPGGTSPRRVISNVA